MSQLHDDHLLFKLGEINWKLGDIYDPIKLDNDEVIKFDDGDMILTLYVMYHLPQ